jgi:hypothetical protein
MRNCFLNFYYEARWFGFIDGDVITQTYGSNDF